MYFRSRYPTSKKRCHDVILTFLGRFNVHTTSFLTSWAFQKDIIEGKTLEKKSVRDYFDFWYFLDLFWFWVFWFFWFFFLIFSTKCTVIFFSALPLRYNFIKERMDQKKKNKIRTILRLKIVFNQYKFPIVLKSGEK